MFPDPKTEPMTDDTKMKEMLGGCNLCGEEDGSNYDPLVYCDGKNCSVAMHKTCYGILDVPQGEWLCNKCQTTSDDVKCELCPQRGGAFKQTDMKLWCHVVCAVYISEAGFGNKKTMQPILLQDIPKIQKPCYICEKDPETKSDSLYGMTLSCSKPECGLAFHVTCGQKNGLLFERNKVQGDLPVYCGFCNDHCYEEHPDMKRLPAFVPMKIDTSKMNPKAEATPDLSNVEKTLDSVIAMAVDSNMDLILEQTNSKKSSKKGRKPNKRKAIESEKVPETPYFRQEQEYVSTSSKNQNQLWSLFPNKKGPETASESGEVSFESEKVPTSLEELLDHLWDCQGQAVSNANQANLDIVDLLHWLYQIKKDSVLLEEEIASLEAKLRSSKIQNQRLSVSLFDSEPGGGVLDGSIILSPNSSAETISKSLPGLTAAGHQPAALTPSLVAMQPLSLVTPQLVSDPMRVMRSPPTTSVKKTAAAMPQPFL